MTDTMPRPPKPDSPNKTRLTPLSQQAVEYGTAIRQAREKHRFSERDLCDEVGCSQTTLNKLENGRAYLTVERLIKITKALNMKPEEIVKDLVPGSQVNNDQVNNPVYVSVQSRRRAQSVGIFRKDDARGD
jgi:transcriptional regulator with XRE-family HTH domain